MGEVEREVKNDLWVQTEHCAGGCKFDLEEEAVSIEEKASFLCTYERVQTEIDSRKLLMYREAG